MSSNHRAIRGVLPVFQTPYHADYTIDFTTLEREIQWLYDQGADGIVMGMVSETLRLSGEERKALAAAACRFGRERGVVIVSAGAESTHTAVDYARHAESVGALRDATGGKAPVLEGTGGIALVDSYRRGVIGTMPGADLIDVLVALWRALEAGDEQRIYQLSLPLGALIAIQTSLDSFLAVEKYLLVKRGIFQNTLVRGPVGYQLDAKTQAEIDRLFARLQEVVRS